VLLAKDVLELAYEQQALLADLMALYQRSHRDLHAMKLNEATLKGKGRVAGGGSAVGAVISAVADLLPSTATNGAD
jgi:hypothetical protein